MSALCYLALYLLAVAADGDYLNDWLTWLPSWSTDGAQLVGIALAVALGHGL